MLEYLEIDTSFPQMYPFRQATVTQNGNRWHGLTVTHPPHADQLKHVWVDKVSEMET